MSRLVKSLCFYLALLCPTALAQPRISNLDVRLEGPGVYSQDDTNGTYWTVKTGTLVTAIFSAQSETNWENLTLPFNLYSPGNQVTSITHAGDISFTPAFGPDVFLLGGPQSGTSSWDGSLPDDFWVGGATFGSDGEPAGFYSSTPVDVFMISFVVPAGENGIVCIDSSFIPPSVSWTVVPDYYTQWGASVGGYPAGGFCFTVIDEYPDCCDLAGDANHDGKITIADLVEVIDRIFNSAPHPHCCRELDADGNGSVTIADAIHHVAYNFLGGPAPICGPSGMSCGD